MHAYLEMSGDLKLAISEELVAGGVNTALSLLYLAGIW